MKNFFTQVLGSLLGTAIVFGVVGSFWTTGTDRVANGEGVSQPPLGQARLQLNDEGAANNLALQQWSLTPDMVGLEEQAGVPVVEDPMTNARNQTPDLSSAATPLTADPDLYPFAVPRRDNVDSVNYGDPTLSADVP